MRTFAATRKLSFVLLRILLLITVLMCSSCSNNKEVTEIGEFTSGDFKYIAYSNKTAMIIDHVGYPETLDIPRKLNGYKVTAIGEAAFAGNTMVSIKIPNTVTSIGDYAFAACVNLGSITIPDSVTSIGKNAFSTCISLYSITIPDSVTQIGDWAFSECYYVTLVLEPASYAEGYARLNDILYTYID